MLDTLDSRALRRTDCYGQRFMKTGTYAYNILPVHGHCVTSERPFAIQVVDSKKKGEMRQHTIIVRTDKGRFVIEEEKLTIEAGELVMWNCVDPQAVPYVVAGDKEFFTSDRLVNECGYSHAFGLPGEYRWADAYGSGLAGVVRVKNADCKDKADFSRWQQMLAKGTIVMVNNGKAEPREVDIVIGQTVFFAVVKGPGISITDEQLLARRDGKSDGPKRKTPAKQK
jgi:plastocyanin